MCGEGTVGGSCTAQESKMKLFELQIMAEKKPDRPTMVCLCELR